MPTMVDAVWQPPGGPARAFTAFVPDPVGALDLDLPGSVHERAEAAAVELARVDAHLPVAWEPIARLLLRSEGLASSDIEGLRVTPRRLLEAGDGDTDPTARWVLGNLDALDHALADLSDLDVDTVCAWHRRLMADSPIPDRYVGRLRTEQGWIGGTSPLDAVYVAPPADHLPGLVDDLVGFCNRGDLPSVIQAAVAHAQFETIHPFGDGNGRIGRILVAWILRRRGVVHRAIPPISPAIAARPDDYVVGLHRYREGDLAGWVGWFSGVCVQAGRRIADLVARVEALVDSWEARLRARADAAARRLLPVLPGLPLVDSRSAAAAAAVSRRAALDALATLERAGILERVSSFQQGPGRPEHRYLATEVLALLER